MYSFTQLTSSLAVVVPPKEEIVYDKLWIDTITITSPSINTISLYCKMIPCRDLPSGEKELKDPLTQEDIKVVTIDNLWIAAQGTPSLAMAMEAVFQAVNEYGKKVGVILDPYMSSSSSSSEVLSSSDSSDSSDSSLGTSNSSDSSLSPVVDMAGSP